jgi:hypothetical protein
VADTDMGVYLLYIKIEKITATYRKGGKKRKEKKRKEKKRKEKKRKEKKSKTNKKTKQNKEEEDTSPHLDHGGESLGE